jgi:hypothetical protein
VPEEPEIETKELQEHIEHAHHGHHAPDEQSAPSWTRSIALTTAILAVFAAVGALEAGALVNEALAKQIQASDTWNEYQASKEKSHLYTISLATLVDSGAKPSPGMKEITTDAASKNDRAGQYQAQIKKEGDKSKDLSKTATGLQEESEKDMKRHEIFAKQVALLQVAIALSAIAALTKVKWVWYASMATGLIGVVLFVMGIV